MKTASSPKNRQPARRANRSACRAFTLIELICVICIVVLLSSLLFPSLQTARQRAISMVCASKLHQIGVAVTAAAGDNNNQYPLIEPDPANPVYPSTAGALPLLTALMPYGLVTNSVQCPADLPVGGQKSNFQIHGSSYQWSPLADGETMGNVQLYFRNRVFSPNSAHLRLALDFTAVHFNRVNWLYADGHTTYVTQ